MNVEKRIQWRNRKKDYKLKFQFIKKRKTKNLCWIGTTYIIDIYTKKCRRMNKLKKKYKNPEFIQLISINISINIK